MSVLDNLSSVLNRSAQAYLRWWIGDPDPDDIRTPRGLLRFLQALGPSVLEAAVFLGAASSVLTQHPCADNLSLGEWVECKKPVILPALLAVLVGAIFHFSRISAEAELAIADEVFSESNRPDGWGSNAAPVVIALQAIGFFLAYLGIAWAAGNILVVSGLLLVVACFDWNTRRLVAEKLPKYFKDFGVAATDHDRSRILKRREVARWYVNEKPHLQKEVAKAAGIAVALGAALVWHWDGHPMARTLSYVTLISTLLVNEIVTLRWRAERDHRLREIRND